MLTKILSRSPNLMDLGTGSFTIDHGSGDFRKLMDALKRCKSLRSFSGFWDASPFCLDSVCPISLNLTVLNLSYAPALQGSDLIKFIRQCFKLQKLWVLDTIGD